MEQREDDGRHDSRLSENARNLNLRNAKGLFGSHSRRSWSSTRSRRPASRAFRTRFSLAEERDHVLLLFLKPTAEHRHPRTGTETPLKSTAARSILRGTLRVSGDPASFRGSGRNPAEHPAGGRKQFSGSGSSYWTGQLTPPEQKRRARLRMPQTTQ